MNRKNGESKVSSESSSRETTLFIVYILRTSSNTLYIGQTNNLERRLKQHQSHTTSSTRYMMMFSSFELVYSETFETRAESMKRETQLKTWSRAKKDALINEHTVLLKKL
jgi:predicted GIY-YIG superfamily endonuclease